MVTLLNRAQRYVGIREIGGDKDHPLIQWWLSLCGFGHDAHDEVPWCSAFVNGVAWDERFQRSKSAMARSWLGVGKVVTLENAVPGNDVVIIMRGTGTQPGPEVRNAPGHVGFYAGHDGNGIWLLGGNQGDGVSLSSYSSSRLLGIRRLKSR